MSAFRVSDAHVALLAAHAQSVGVLCKWTSHWMACEMMRENDASICARYSDEQSQVQQPLVLWRARLDRFQSVLPHLSLTCVVKLLDCYEYQSCEHKHWATCEVRQFVHAYREHVLRLMQRKHHEVQSSDEWQSCPWGLDNSYNVAALPRRRT